LEAWIDLAIVSGLFEYSVKINGINVDQERVAVVMSSLVQVLIDFGLWVVCCMLHCDSLGSDGSVRRSEDGHQQDEQEHDSENFQNSLEVTSPVSDGQQWDASETTHHTDENSNHNFSWSFGSTASERIH